LKYLKIICNKPTSAQCHDEIKKIHPNVISIYHEPNNHILYFKDDYDENGHVIGKEVFLKKLI